MQVGVICACSGPFGAAEADGAKTIEAWADSVPILLLSGQVNADRMHLECGAYHEIDLEGIFRPVTKWVGTLADRAQLPAHLEHAFAALTTGRPRPAALILPQDLMRQPFECERTAPAVSVVLPPLPLDRVAAAV